MKSVYERLASSVERMAAALTDLAVSVVLGVAAGLVLKISDVSIRPGIWIYLLCAFLIYIVKDIAGGRSIGKRIVNIAVRKAGNPEKPPGILRGILRNITILIAPVEIIIMLADRNNRRMGDYLFNTACIRLGEESGQNKERLERYRMRFSEDSVRSKNIRKAYIITVICLCIALLFSMSIVFLVRGIVLNSKAYEAAVYAIEGNPLVERITGDVEGYGFMPIGNFSIRNGYGYASWTIKVKGEDSNVFVHIKLTKDKGGEWVVEEALLED